MFSFAGRQFSVAGPNFSCLIGWICFDFSVYVYKIEPSLACDWSEFDIFLSFLTFLRSLFSDQSSFHFAKTITNFVRISFKSEILQNPSINLSVGLCRRPDSCSGICELIVIKLPNQEVHCHWLQTHPQTDIFGKKCYFSGSDPRTW